MEIFMYFKNRTKSDYTFRDYLREMTSHEAQIHVKNLDIPDNIEDMTRKQALKHCPEVLALYDEMIDTIRMSSYENSVEFIDDIIKDPKLKFLLSLGFGGNFASLHLRINNDVVSARTLIPTQREIGLKESLDFILGSADKYKPQNTIVCFEDAHSGAMIKRPIVTFNKTFIIDGHHRWSQMFITNPKTKIKAVNITGNLPIISLLKAIQSTIGSNTGDLHLKPIKGSNIFDMSDADIDNYINDNLSQKACNVLEQFYDDPVESIYNNTLLLKYNTVHISSCVERDLMPQTSKDISLFTDLKNGVESV